MTEHSRWIAALLACLLPWLGCSDSGGTSNGRAQELADRLSAALEFQNSSTVDGPPPAEHADDSSFPQTTGFDVPSVIPYGHNFVLALRTDFVDSSRIAGGVVHVEHASKHIVIDSPYNSDSGSVNLLGSLIEDPQVAGQSFTIRVGLLDDKDELGNTLPWVLDTPALDELEPDAGADAGAE